VETIYETESGNIVYSLWVNSAISNVGQFEGVIVHDLLMTKTGLTTHNQERF